MASENIFRKTKMEFQGFGMLDVVPTWRCQLACSYCYNNGKCTLKGKQDDMPVDVQDAAVDFLLEHRANPKNLATMGIGFTWYGGEASLVPAIVDRMHTRLKEKIGACTDGTEKAPIRCSMPSNFVHFSEEFKAIVKKWRINLQVSCDGPEGHAVQRTFPDGTSPYAEIIENARWYADERKLRMLQTRATITPANVERLAADFRELWSLGFTRVTGMPAWEVEGWNPAAVKKLREQTEQIAEYIVGAFETGRIVSTKWLEDPFRRAQGNWRKPRWTCGAGRNALAAAPNGDLWPCHRFCGNDASDPKWKSYYLGNVLKGDYDKADQERWFNVDTMRDERTDCSECPCYPHCVGGCPYLNTVMTGDARHTPELLCDYTRMTHALAMRINFVLQKQNNSMWARWMKHFIRDSRQAHMGDRMARPIAMPTCVHRGGVLYLHECKSCSGKLTNHKIYECAKHGKCTLARIPVPDVKSCFQCFNDKER